MMMNITFDYRDISDDPQRFDWREEVRLIHETETELDEFLGDCQGATALLYDSGELLETWWLERTYLDICSKVEGIYGVSV